jgi:hypothetical protein
MSLKRVIYAADVVRFVTSVVQEYGIYNHVNVRKMRWASHVARIGRRGTRIDYWWESQKEIDH